MDKDKILEQSRAAKKDEGLENAKLKGNMIGEYAMSVVALPIAIYSLFVGEFVVAWAIGGIAFAFVFGQSFNLYRFTKRKYHLAWTIFSVIFTIIFIVQFLAESQGWWVTWGPHRMWG
ncbi:MAG: DUF6442 family protein [Defluviitaleaceae bacterium]|nr:DUF6442 family protein [Defluviitaleaceae bacterium]